MAVLFSSGYVLPSGDLPLTFPRIAHAGNEGAWDSVVIENSDASEAYNPDGPANDLLEEKWRAASLPSGWGYTAAADQIETLKNQTRRRSIIA